VRRCVGFEKGYADEPGRNFATRRLGIDDRWHAPDGGRAHDQHGLPARTIPFPTHARRVTGQHGRRGKVDHHSCSRSHVFVAAPWIRGQVCGINVRRRRKVPRQLTSWQLVLFGCLRFLLIWCRWRASYIFHHHPAVLLRRCYGGGARGLNKRYCAP
jgi:hypothetical protein